MSRIPLDYLDVDFGEDASYTPPTGSTRWSAFRRTDLMAPMDPDHAGNPGITHGGAPPEWTIFGGFNIIANTYIPQTRKRRELIADVRGFEGEASATGFSLDWDTLREFTGGLQREALMVVAYISGKAIRKTIFRVPAPSSIDPGVIAAQERRTLQSLLVIRDKRAGAGGVIKTDHGDGAGEEFESLAVLDRRIAECRARIAWFEQASEGNPLPRAVYW